MCVGVILGAVGEDGSIDQIGAVLAFEENFPPDLAPLVAPKITGCLELIKGGDSAHIYNFCGVVWDTLRKR